MDIKVITESEVSQEFHQAMVNRMEVSFHKYGAVMGAKGKVDEIASLKRRLQLYETTGNTEWLVDVANLAMIEFMHKGADAFRATDSDESPGLIKCDGDILVTQHSPKGTDYYRREGD